MNNRERMYDSNSKVRKWLKNNNYLDIHFFPHTRFSKDVHFQGLSFDGCCSLGKQFILFQIKTNCKPTKKIQKQIGEVSKESSIGIIWFDVVKRKGVQSWVYL